MLAVWEFWSVVTALTALSFNFISLFFFRMLLGVGEAGYFPAGTAMMGDYFPRAKRSRVMSWWSIAQLVGILVGYALGGELAGIYVGSWRLAFLFTGIPGLALAFLAWKLREPRHNEADEDEEMAGTPAIADVVPVAPPPANPFSQMRNLLRIKTLVVLIVMQIFAFFVLSVATVYLPTFLQQRDLYGLSSGFAGSVLRRSNRAGWPGRARFSAATWPTGSTGSIRGRASWSVGSAFCSAPQPSRCL